MIVLNLGWRGFECSSLIRRCIWILPVQIYIKKALYWWEVVYVCVCGGGIFKYPSDIWDSQEYQVVIPQKFWIYLRISENS